MATEDILINDGDSFVSLTALTAEQVEAELPISSEDKSILLGQAIVGENEKAIVAGTQFVIVINDATTMRLSDTGRMTLYGSDSTTFVNQSTSLACFSQFQSDRSSCFVGTESYSPFVVKDHSGSSTILQVNSSLDVQAPNNIITSTGKFQGQAWTTTSPADGDPEIRMRNSPQQIEMGTGDTDLLFVHPLYVKSFVDIQTVGIAGRVAPTTDARIDLGASFVVSKGDGTERFSINAQSGAIKQTSSAYTPIVIDGSNETGALIKSSCGGGTYSFGATNLGWLVMDDALTPLLTVSATDIKAKSSYVPLTDSSIATKGYTDTADQLLQSNINGKAEIWVGTQDQYDSLSVYDEKTLYCITD